jgi:N-acetyl-anhydromuramyl-L-alanine amidase AmpD
MKTTLGENMRRRIVTTAFLLICGAFSARAAAPELPIFYSQEIVDKIREHSKVPYPPGVSLQSKSSEGVILAIILHATSGPDSTVRFLRLGRIDLPGPGAHWAVLSDGSITLIAEETRKANHLGRAINGLRNDNTIGIESIGRPPFSDVHQVENLVRLVADVADRWEIPTSKIFSHAEVFIPLGRKQDMLQQAPAIREMVDAVRQKK